MSKTTSNTSSIISKIARIGKELSRIYEDFLIVKYNYLNHKRIVEYLFNKPLEKVSSYYNLMAINYDSSVKLVRLEKKGSTEFDYYFSLLNKNFNNFSDKYDLYEKYIKIYEQQHDKNFNNLLKFDYLPVLSKSTIHERKIIQILNGIYDAIDDKYHCLYKWNFMVEGEYTNLMKLPTVNYQQSFVYDFYGITLWHNQLVQFVILFDDDSHFDSTVETFEKIHHDDILKQYMLYQMNIHLLRLNKRSDLKKEIYSFIKRIRISTKYIIEGKIKPISRFFQSNKIINELVLFKEDYQYNHLIYLKTPVKKCPDYVLDDDKYFEQQSIKDNYSEVAADSGAMVSTDVLKNIIEDKKDFHPLKKNKTNEERANEIIVELKRDNGVESDHEANDDDSMLDEEEEKEILKIVFS
jgi:hypothetical protein